MYIFLGEGGEGRYGTYSTLYIIYGSSSRKCTKEKRFVDFNVHKKIKIKIQQSCRKKLFSNLTLCILQCRGNECIYNISMRICCVYWVSPVLRQLVLFYRETGSESPSKACCNVDGKRDGFVCREGKVFYVAIV